MLITFLTGASLILASPLSDEGSGTHNPDGLALLETTRVAATKHEGNQMDSLCSKLGGLAEGIMELRQSGGSLSKVKATMRTSTPNSLANEMADQIVMRAWNTPRYTTPSVVANVIADFRNDIELACYIAFSKDAE